VQQPVAKLRRGYLGLLQALKTRILEAQLKATLAVNQELLLLYWDIGREILSRQKAKGWGAKIVERLAKDLHRAFPEMDGLSSRNLNYMRAFAAAYPGVAIVKQSVGKIPWGHNITLLEKVTDQETRLWYAGQTLEHGWSRAVLMHQVDTRLHERQGKAINNFARTLPPAQSDLARQLLKDPYNFDFLTIRKDALERDLEGGLLKRIRDFLLELGTGFAFVGQQFPVEIDGETYYIDLLFYHLRLRAYIAIDLKMEAFKPEFAGKMNFYLVSIDELLKRADDAPTIGLILCKTHRQVIAEYSLRGTAQPVGIARYTTSAPPALPTAIRAALPSKSMLEQELRRLKLPVDHAAAPRISRDVTRHRKRRPK